MWEDVIMRNLENLTAAAFPGSIMWKRMARTVNRAITWDRVVQKEAAMEFQRARDKTLLTSERDEIL